MKQIRKGVFETNSSSTHSIAIPKENQIFKKNVFFSIDEFGWEFDSVDPADYLYTAIYEVSENKKELQDRLNKLKTILEDNGIDYKFDEVRCEECKYEDDYITHEYIMFEDGYIDHGDALINFVDDILNDGEKLIRFISGGFVFTGNDNADEDACCFVNRTEKTYESYDHGWKNPPVIKKNPYYMENHEDYDWYYKGN